MYDAFIRSLPKTETHLHFEGALPFELVHRQDPKRFPKPPASWAPDFRFRDFLHFEGELLDMAGTWCTSPERYYEAAQLILGRLYNEQNVRYVETSFASGVMEFLKLDGRVVAEAITAAAPKGLELRVFMGIHHTGWNEQTRDFLLDSVNWPHLAGIDLHGVETLPLDTWADGLWERFRDAGKLTKAHAGEFCGPDFVREVLRRLKVKRIEHGVRSVEDPSLLDELREAGITLDVCPISNVKLGVAPSLREHPLRRLLDAGICCTVNTDDPMSFGNTLFDEYQALATEMDFTPEELREVARNGFKIADVDEPKRQQWMRELDAVPAPAETAEERR